MNRLMSQGQAIRSTLAFSCVTHFIAVSFRSRWLPSKEGRPAAVLVESVEEEITVARLEEGVVGDRLVPVVHATVKDEALGDVGLLLDLRTRDERGVERVTVLNDYGDPDPGRVALGAARAGQICSLVRAS